MVKVFGIKKIALPDGPDVDLTVKGIAEAERAGELLLHQGFHFDRAYTSYLKRAVKTLNCVLDKLNQDWIPVDKTLATERKTLRYATRLE